MPDEVETTDSLRGKLEKALSDLAKANSTIATMQADTAFSGVTVSDRQRKIILRELGEDKLDVTAENVQSVAKDLGFGQSTTPPPPPAGGDQQTQQVDSGNGQDNGQSAEDQKIMVSLDEISVIDRANFHARRGNISQDLSTKIANAKTPEELTHLIRTEGAASGLVHEWDTQ